MDQVLAGAGEDIGCATTHRSLVRKIAFTGSYDAINASCDTISRNGRPRSSSTTHPVAWLSGFWCRAEDNRPQHGRSARDLGLRHDPGLESAPVRRGCLGSENRNLAWLTPPRLRDLRRRPGAECPRQSQVRHHQKACCHDPEVQRAYAEIAEGYVQLISPCPPRPPQNKGIVESGVKYIKNNFQPLRDFRDIADANR